VGSVGALRVGVLGVDGLLDLVDDGRHGGCKNFSSGYQR
jgi:hypothetical protein